jgi:hypothetical protein
MNPDTRQHSPQPPQHFLAWEPPATRTPHPWWRPCHCASDSESLSFSLQVSLIFANNWALFTSASPILGERLHTSGLLFQITDPQCLQWTWFPQSAINQNRKGELASTCEAERQQVLRRLCLSMGDRELLMHCAVPKRKNQAPESMGTTGNHTHF